MSIFNSIKQSITAKKQSAMEQYIEVIGRADTPLDGDSKTLEKLLTQLGISVEQAEQDAAVLAEVRTLQPTIEDMPNLSKRASEARRAALDAEASLQSIIINGRRECERLAEEKGKADSRLGSGTEAIQRLQTIVKKNPKLFPISPLLGHEKWL